MKWRTVYFDDQPSPYKISEHGLCYSLRKKRLLKGAYNSKLYPYKYYFINGSWHYAHRLVYMAFVGPIQHEINHIDNNRGNNHYTNLEDVTHMDNMRMAREIKNWRPGRPPGFKLSQITKDKMRAAKYKPVHIYCEDKLIGACMSIEETAQYLNTYRKKIYRALKSGKRVRFQADTYILKYA